jgi:hypothetical protein
LLLSWYNILDLTKVNNKKTEDKMQQHPNDSSKYSKIMLELVHLRQTDYDAFMDKLYEALTGEFRGAVHDAAPQEEKNQAIWTMIDHFKRTEQYEKCANLKSLAAEMKLIKPEMEHA